MALTMRLAMIFSFTRLPFGAGLVCDHLYPNFIEAFGIIDSIEVIRLITPITLGGHIEKILKIIKHSPKKIVIENVF